MEVRAKESAQHGMYNEVPEEAFLELVTKTKLVVAHFYHSDFNRCRIVDDHLERLAPRHFHTKFIKCNVENFPFFVEKLKIRMLPTIVCFRDGVCIDRVVGFEELGSTDDFETSALEARLGMAGMVKRGGDNPYADGSIARNDDDDGVIGSRERTLWSAIPITSPDEDIDFDA
ncbi:thioredoxin domain-containing protein c [Thecamonas trahens ATCC 50062]|uniref:Thioredoxin domain-containing protein c n=1 Tax=Thecamonas trahens ATCC 50062 TaxID=461836 RepID=A0A0L0DCA1_THETB|nr:thioredoxin domain-containing protein c [Thecamonas trahens ATCC 50062]KNC49711.1 thioredoxin domain-containing protein c [Thecamonas trahens ATCC 50062]|eukprot:XP_013757502.1 thioredoxin domain-containing protein c [Thecamonas trahens ATCC 50062]